MKKNKILVFGFIFCLCTLYVINIYSPYKIEFIGYHNKVWGHRTNSIEKLNTGLVFFKGLELDLVYNFNSNFLDVNHPPKKSINLSFENYIAEISEKKTEKPYLWLDIKNLTEYNSLNILKRINSIFDEYKYPHEKILIESNKPKNLELFYKNNYRTSYYLPNDLYKKKNNELKKELKKIKDNLYYNDLEISFNAKNYELVNKNFPERFKNTWILPKLSLLNYFSVRKIIKDPKIKTVLVKYYSLKGER